MKLRKKNTRSILPRTKHVIQQSEIMEEKKKKELNYEEIKLNKRWDKKNIKSNRIEL